MVSVLKQKDYVSLVNFMKTICTRNSKEACKYVVKMANNLDESN